jgi:hypothetical protein
MSTEDLIAVTITTFLGCWFVVSLLGQLPKTISDKVRRLDGLGIIPHWNFFAPRPAQSDYHLLYRDQLWDGSITEWVELYRIETRSLAACIWNPKRRQNKALFDACNSLLRDGIEGNVSLLPLSLSYLLLLNCVTAARHDESAVSTQFLLMASSLAGGGRGIPTPVLISPRHFLERAELTTADAKS